MKTNKSLPNRRDFLAQSLMASVGAVTAVQAAEAPSSGSVSVAKPKSLAFASKGTMPTGKIGPLTISRLISGGNLISGWAHSRDLQYVPSLMRAYNTEEKVMDTLQLLEEFGVNTLIADPRKNVKGVLARYWKERGGRMQWIAEGHPDLNDWKTNMKESIDFGAKAVYVQGVISDRWLKLGRVDLLGQCVEFIKSQGVPAGLGAHKIEVVIEAERRKFNPDFYVKTCHHSNYWSSRRPDQSADVVDNPADNYWDKEPRRTVQVMAGVNKPWIGFKTLAAGGIRPESGFKYAFENGADFICVGMFDFQVQQNAALAKQILKETENRDRDWMA